MTTSLADWRIAVVGCGGAGAKHLGALARRGIFPAAVLDPDPSRAAAAAVDGRTVVASSLDEVVEACDVAILAGPDDVHVEQATQLLAAGRHVLVEKPLATTRASAQRVVDADASSGATLSVAHLRRQVAGLAWSQRVVRSEALGPIQHVDLAQGGLDGWVAASADAVTRAGGGVLVNQGSHVIDLLQWMLGPLVVQRCTTDGRGGLEAEAEVHLTAGAATVRVALSRVRPRRNSVQIHAERGILEVASDEFRPVQVMEVPPGVELPPFTAGRQRLDDLFDAQLTAFEATLDGRRPPTLATAADGLAVAGVIEDAYARRLPHEPWWMTSAVPTP